jgi:hypothetical protein
MTNNPTITLRQDELAGYQRAIESAKDRIALLSRSRDEARVDLEKAQTARLAWTEIGAKAEADTAAFRERVVAACRIGGGGLYAIEELLKEPHPGTALLAELKLLRELADDLARWREAGGDIRDLTYVLETMDRIAATKEGSR